jgi:hypothetical protein
MMVLEVETKEKSTVHAFHERRYGRFSVPRDVIDDGEFSEVAALFAGMIILRCEFMAESGKFHYTACGPMFEPLELYMEAPLYMPECTVTQNDGDRTVAITFRRI